MKKNIYSEFEVKETVERKNIEVYAAKTEREIFREDILVIVILILLISLLSSIWLVQVEIAVSLIGLLGFSIKVLFNKHKLE